MAGLAQTDNFMLGTATVMIGPVADLYNLEPTTHSIGLVKNFTMTTDPQYVELTQGVKNQVVHSTMTGNRVTATMEAYEYTAKNLAYSLGVEGAEGVMPKTVTTTTTAPIVAAATTVPVTSATGITVGSYIMIENGAEDNLVVRRVTAVASLNLTVDQGLPAIATAAKVSVVNAIDIGQTTNQPFYSAKVVGIFANGEACVIHIPKVRIVKGFSLAFASSDYGNLPIEFTIYDLVSTDPFYASFKTKSAQMFRK